MQFISAIQKLRGRVDHILGPKRLRRSFPMNGQTARVRMVDEVFLACSPLQVIETGTYLGRTTEWFALKGLPVETIELNPRWYSFSQMRLKRYTNVKSHKGNSVLILEKIAKNTQYKRKPVFFYLDAHWNEYLPLREEVKIISKHFEFPIILIDDFQVPNDRGYKFDNYGPEKQLTLEYLRKSGIENLRIFFPTTPSENESGNNKRGCAVTTTSDFMAERLSQVSLLKAWND